MLNLSLCFCFSVFLRVPAGGRLYDAVYEPGNFCALPEARETTTELVLLPVTTVPGCLDLYGDSVLGRLCAALYLGQVRESGEG